MSEAEKSAGGSGGGQDGNERASGDHRQDKVSITINNKSFEVHRGRQAVSEIKALGGVPLADELAQVIERNSPQLTPLKDDGHVTIKGGEIFVSYPKDSGSSH